LSWTPETLADVKGTGETMMKVICMCLAFHGQIDRG
jgi:hypothetical protein